MLPIAGISFVGPNSPKSAAQRPFEFARFGGRATIAAWLLMLVTPADGAAPRAAALTFPGRSSAPMVGLLDALACHVQWAEYHALRAIGVPCTPPNC